MRTGRPYRTLTGCLYGGPPLSRTLIISDLHLGSPSRTSVLERPEPLERLLDAVAQADRLVLLGDVVELVEAGTRASLDAAGPILRALGNALSSAAEVLFVPGNHDRPMIRAWLRSRGRRLGLEDSVPLDASPALEFVAAQLGPSGMQIRYPGARLSETVWVTHGHYLDRHLIPVSNWGRLRGSRRRPPEDHAAPWQYERRGRVGLGPAMRWLPAPLATRIREAGSLIRATTMPAIQDNVLDPRIAPLTSRLLSLQMRRHALPALSHVVHRLEVEADWVVFGHVHRLGPLAVDEPAQWRDPDLKTGFLNAGSWLFEPRLINRAEPPHPYWPGGAVILDDGSPPRAVGLLDDLPLHMLGPPPSAPGP
jgi:UDP-2,3-diacylglucosamine pyrophosphatase LpxH